MYDRKQDLIKENNYNCITEEFARTISRGHDLIHSVNIGIQEACDYYTSVVLLHDNNPRDTFTTVRLLFYNKATFINFQNT